MAIKTFKYFDAGVGFKDQAADVITSEGVIYRNGVALKIYIQAAVRNIVTDTQSQTLTNKSISGATNTITSIPVTALTAIIDTDLSSVSASHDTIPSAKATKDYVDAQVLTKDAASEIAFTPAGTIAATNTQAAVEEVSQDFTDHLNDTIDAHDASAISNVPAGNLAATEVQAALNELQSDIDSRALASGLSDHLSDAIDAHDASAISNIPAGNLAAVDVQTALNELQSDIDTRTVAGTLVLPSSQHIELQAATDATTTGADATLTAFSAGGVRITNGSLTSIANIPAGTNGQQVTIFNRTGASVSIKDSADLLGTAANRILTGTGADISMAANSALIFSYDSTSTRWQIVGGSGSGGAAITSDRYEVDATLGQTVINLPFSIAQNATEKKALQLYVDGIMLREGPAYDFEYTNPSGGFSSQVTLNSPLAAGISIMALKVGGYTNTSSTVVSTTTPNYITNIGAETDTTGFATYLDAAGTSPVDGTGGSSAITLTRSTVSPLRGTASYLLTKGGSTTRQGNGFSYDFAIDLSDRGKVLQASFEYKIASGTFADNDLVVYILDVTNNRLIQGAPYQIKNSGIIEKFNTEFQTSSDSGSYRLIVHVSSTSILDYTVQFDNFNVGPQAKLYGSPITDWRSYTPTFTGLGTPTAVAMYYRRDGDSIEIEGRFTAGTTTATEARLSFPSGLVSGDSTKVSTMQIVGNLVASTSTSAPTKFVTAQPSVDYITFNNYAALDTTAFTPRQGSALFNAGEVISLFAKVPIQGWSSSQVMSSDADTRVVAARYKCTTADTTSQTGPNNINYDTKVIDTHAAVTTSATAWKFTVPVPGIYRVSASNQASSGITGIYLYKNASNVASICGNNVAVNITSSGSLLVECVAGDNLTVDNGTGGAMTLVADGSMNYINIERISGPSQIAASESVSALYTGAPPTGTLNGSDNLTTFGTKVKDSHNAYSSGVYTIPVSGVYSISANCRMNGTYSGTQASGVTIYISGVATYSRNSYLTSGAVYDEGIVNVHSIPLLAGTTVDIRSFSQATTPTFGSSATQNWFSIVRTGNY